MDPDELLDSGSLLPLTAAHHTGLINSVPDQFGQLNADGMFPSEGLDTPYVRIDIDDGVITALPVTEGGRPSTIARHGKGKGVIFEIPNVSHEDSVLAADIRSWMAYARRTRTPDDALINKVETRRRPHHVDGWGQDEGDSGHPAARLQRGTRLRRQLHAINHAGDVLRPCRA